MKKLLFMLFMSNCYSVFSQVAADPNIHVFNGMENGIDSLDNPRKNRFVLGIGFNIIDNTSTRNNQFLNWSKHYNAVPYPSKVSLERKWNAYFAAGAAMTFNKLRKEQYQNGEITLVDNINYFGLDMLGKLFIDEYFLKKSWLDIHINLGLGMHTADQNFNQTFDFGAGLDVWFSPKYGVRLQTLGKHAFDRTQLANNHIQHSVEFLFRI